MEIALDKGRTEGGETSWEAVSEFLRLEDREEE